MNEFIQPFGNSNLSFLNERKAMKNTTVEGITRGVLSLIAPFFSIVAWGVSARSAVAKLCAFALILISSILAVGGAMATPVTWTIYNGTFANGDTLTGSFTYDADTNTYSNWNLQQITPQSTPRNTFDTGNSQLNRPFNPFTPNVTSSKLTVYKTSTNYVSFDFGFRPTPSTFTLTPLTNQGAPVSIFPTVSSFYVSTNFPINSGYVCVAPCTPTVSGVSQSSGSAIGGTSVVITGTNLLGASAVKFGNTNATSYTVNSATQITAVSPAGSAGTVNITVTTAAGTTSTSASDQFTYLVPPPAVSAVSPSSGSTQGGTSITITGTNLSGATSVTVGGAACTSVVASATSVSCTTPSGSAGTASVLVTTAGGTNLANTLFSYFVPAPTVTSVSPSSGPTEGGTIINITGTNFSGASGVTVGGAACSTFSVTNSTAATCTTPPGSAGTASVLVTTAGGTNAANSLFTYVFQPIPTLSEWAMLLMASLMAMFGYTRLRNRQV